MDLTKHWNHFKQMPLGAKLLFLFFLYSAGSGLDLFIRLPWIPFSNFGIGPILLASTIASTILSFALCHAIWNAKKTVSTLITARAAIAILDLLLVPYSTPDILKYTASQFIQAPPMDPNTLIPLSIALQQIAGILQIALLLGMLLFVRRKKNYFAH